MTRMSDEIPIRYTRDVVVESVRQAIELVSAFSGGAELYLEESDLVLDSIASEQETDAMLVRFAHLAFGMAWVARVGLDEAERLGVDRHELFRKAEELADDWRG